MRTTFSSDEIAELRRNPCVFDCTEKSVYYTPTNSSSAPWSSTHRASRLRKSGDDRALMCASGKSTTSDSRSETGDVLWKGVDLRDSQVQEEHRMTEDLTIRTRTPSGDWYSRSNTCKLKTIF